MIYEIGVEIGAAIAARGCPLKVVDGPEAAAPVTGSRERIVIEHDLDGGDSFGPVKSAHTNPKHVATRRIGAKLTIYAQSPKPGAQLFEHRRRAEHVLDLVFVALSQVARKRANECAVGAGKFLEAADLEASARYPGAVYELKFDFGRAVEVRDWDGEKQPEATLEAGGVHSITKVSRASGPDDDNDPTTPPADAETSCGG